MTTNEPMVKREFFAKPQRLEKQEPLTPLQIEFKEKCEKYPVIAVYTAYSYKGPHFIGAPEFIKVREVAEGEKINNFDDYMNGNWIRLDELDIEPPSGEYPRILPIRKITSYDEVNKCYNGGEALKIKFYQEV